MYFDTKMNLFLRQTLAVLYTIFCIHKYNYINDNNLMSSNNNNFILYKYNFYIIFYNFYIIICGGTTQLCIQNILYV